MSNDNRKPISPMGRALFNMMADMAQAQANVYAKNGLNGAPDPWKYGDHAVRIEAEAQAAVDRVAQAHRPYVIDSIIRTGENK